MKDKENKNQVDADKLVKDINSVPKMTNNEGNEFVDDPKRPAQGGSRGASSDQDGGQDSGSSTGSH